MYEIERERQRGKWRNEKREKVCVGERGRGTMGKRERQSERGKQEVGEWELVDTLQTF